MKKSLKFFLLSLAVLVAAMVVQLDLKSEATTNTPPAPEITASIANVPEVRVFPEITVNPLLKTIILDNITYKILEVDGGDLSGSREKNIAVDIGFGDRKYWAFTNEYGQLTRVLAKEIVLQNDETEPVLSTGRYYPDEAKVPGTEADNLDEGHVIADSLGGVSNAYNITPQESTLNRHGDQAYMEDVLRKALQSGEKVTAFEAIITYPNTETQIPSHYKFIYKIGENLITDEFDNINPDEINIPMIEEQKTEKNNTSSQESYTEEDLSKIDANGNGKVTIAEAKAAGFKMPIYSDHWLYKYMTDSNKNGMVGE